MAAKSALIATASVFLIGFVSPIEAGKCTAPETVQFKTSSQVSETASATFVGVPTGAVRFNGSSVPNCVLVRFSAIKANSIPMELRVLLDGSAVAGPGPIPWLGTEGEPASFDFVLPAVGPGSHTVAVQWRNVPGGDVAKLGARTLIVSY